MLLPLHVPVVAVPVVAVPVVAVPVVAALSVLQSELQPERPLLLLCHQLKTLQFQRRDLSRPPHRPCLA